MGAIVTIDSRPALLVRGHEITTVVGLYDGDDVAVVPASWTVALVLGGVSVLTDSGTGAVSWPETIAATVALGDAYRLDWVFTESDGTTTPHSQAASVCLHKLYPVVRVQDLVDRVPRLSLTATEPLLAVAAADSKTMMLSAMSTAWDDIEDWLRNKGNRSHLVIDSHSLKAAHVLHTLEVLLHGVASSLGGGQYLDMARDFRDEYRAALRDLTLQYAPADGTGAGRRRQASVPIFTGGAWDVDERYRYQNAVPSTWRSS